MVDPLSPGQRETLEKMQTLPLLQSLPTDLKHQAARLIKKIL